MIDFSAPPSPLQLIEDDFLLQKKLSYISKEMICWANKYKATSGEN